MPPVKPVKDSSTEWSQAFANQALSDLHALSLLAKAAKCHKLHYLQMAAEKTCKAYLWAKGGSPGTSHAYIAGTLPVIAREILSRAEGRSKMGWLADAIKHFAKEIEFLAPAVKNENRQDNCEYPWMDGSGKIQIPCRHQFANLDLNERAVVRIVELIRGSAEKYSAAQPHRTEFL